MRMHQANGDWPQQTISGVFNHNCMITYANYRRVRRRGRGWGDGRVRRLCGRAALSQAVEAGARCCGHAVHTPVRCLPGTGCMEWPKACSPHPPHHYVCRGPARRNIFPIWALGMYRRVVLMGEDVS